MSKEVLLIDDDPVIRSLVQTILEMETFSVTTAEHGRQGAEIVEGGAKKFDLIIVDRQMPEMSGLDFLTRIKLKSDTATVPTIMLTGESRPEDIMAGYEVGADYYITKPFTRQQLIYGLELVLGKYK
jgi:DNA-binding response OmpR family regulator